MPVKAVRSWWDVVSWWFVIWLYIPVPGCVLTGLLPPDVNGDAAVAVIVALLPLLLGMTVRSVLLGVFATPDGVTVRRMFRTWFLPWPSIQGVGEFPTTDIRGGLITIPSVRYVDHLGRPREIALWRLAAQLFRIGSRRAEQRLRLVLGDQRGSERSSFDSDGFAVRPIDRDRS